MKYMKTFTIGGEKFTVICESDKEMFWATKHYGEMEFRSGNIKSYDGDLLVEVKYPRWVARENEGYEFYEIRAVVNGERAKMQISLYKDPPKNLSEVNFYLGANSRWELYDQEEEQNYVLEYDRAEGVAEWVPATKTKKGWDYEEDGWWNDRED